MLETAAVYWESMVRIYGFREKTGLSLFTLVFPAGRTEYWGARIEAMAEANGGFELVFSQPLERKFHTFSLVFAENADYSFRQQIARAAENEAGTSLSIDFPVEMISFHGPHFQDRYGIVSAAFDALQGANYRILASGCTGNSISMVLPADTARPAVEHLAKTFIIPRTANGTR